MSLPTEGVTLHIKKRKDVPGSHIDSILQYVCYKHKLQSTSSVFAILQFLCLKSLEKSLGQYTE